MSFWNPSARIAEALGRDPSSPSLHSQPSPYSQRPPESPGFALAEAWADGTCVVVDALKAARPQRASRGARLVQAREELDLKDAQLAQQRAALSARDTAGAELGSATRRWRRWRRCTSVSASHSRATRSSSARRATR